MAIQYTPSSLLDKITGNNYSYTHSVVRKITEVDTNIEKLQDKTETFRKNIRSLKHYSPGGTSKTRLEKQLTDFIKSYNDIQSSSSSITDKDVQKQLTKLKNLFSDNEKNLKKIGITQTNGKYSLDSDTFEDASDTIINNLLTGYDSFLGKADRIMRKLDENAGDALYNVVDQNISSTAQYNQTDLAYAQQAVSTGQALTNIKQYVAQPDFSDENVQKTISNNLSVFSASIDKLFSTTKQENLDKLIQILNNEENKDNLNKVGLSFDSEKQEMSFNQNTDMSTEDFETAYNALFGKNASFGDAISAYCKTVYNDIVQPDKLGVSFIDAQM